MNQRKVYRLRLFTKHSGFANDEFIVCDKTPTEIHDVAVGCLYARRDEIDHVDVHMDVNYEWVSLMEVRI